MIFQKGQNFWPGKHHTEETKKKLSEAHKGKKASEETKRKLTLLRIGKKHFKEWNENISKGNRGKKMSNEAKENMKKNHWMKKQSYSSEKNGRWKGDEVSYIALHLWIKKNKSKPKLCVLCNERPPQELSNISGKYKRDINDFQWICKKCHFKFDNKNFGKKAPVLEVK